MRNAILSANALRSVWGLNRELLALASFGGAPYSLDEPSTVKCVLESRSSVGPFTQIADKLSVDLSYIDCRLHGPGRDRGRVRFNEWDICRQLEIAGLEATSLKPGRPLIAGTCDTFAQLALVSAPTIPTRICSWVTVQPRHVASDRHENSKSSPRPDRPQRC